MVIIIKLLYIYRYEIVLIAKGVNKYDFRLSLYNQLAKTYSGYIILKQVQSFVKQVISGFGYERISNFSWRHNQHFFVMFEYGATDF